MSLPELDTIGQRGHVKDEVLASPADSSNVAQFASFSPGAEPRLRYLRVHHLPRPMPDSVETAVALVLEQASERSVNVRAFDPHQPKAHEFLYGLTVMQEVVREVRRLAAAGLHTIVNETIDVTDGGVSGVVYGGVLECAPDDTPRCVEKPGIAAFPRDLGLHVLETIYGFRPELDVDDNIRTEFSIHPLRRGLRESHTILWEQEATAPIELASAPTWPNRLSRFLGDKTFGLLVADAIGLPVPETTVVSRRVAPFRFGRATGSGEFWIRTCPIEQVPGKFTTHRGWRDPYALLSAEDPTGLAIAAVLSQEGVPAAFSGAAAKSIRGDATTVEGVRGAGDRFMLGEASPEPLPAEISSAVRQLVERAAQQLGPVRVEWVHDGDEAWLVQLHSGGSTSVGRVLYPGTSAHERRFNTDEGIEKLRELVAKIEGTGEGLVLVGNVGVTSHFGDVVRKARIPSRIELPVQTGWNRVGSTRRRPD